ncbi:MAG TPA: tryptophan synthase subunit alpha [Actinomycetota bacterium]|nr:tryptophan synthase subunit alpha [Actinomycetota bacterium]
MGVFKRDERLPEHTVVTTVGDGSPRRSLSSAFETGKREGRALLMPFLVCGYPDPDAFLACVEAAGTAGADVLEIGIPFSDPIMDGPLIAAASTKVLDRGQTVDDAFGLLARASAAFGRPMVAMTYYNLLLRRGLKRFAGDCAAAGVSGVIVPDLAVEESLQWGVACEQAGIAAVFMASVTSSPERLRQIAHTSEGFIYAASTLGVTGVRDSLGDRARTLVASLREATSKPVAVGIGVSTPEHAREVAGYADGVIVGSALVQAIDDGGPEPAKRVVQLVTALRDALG